jgi:hypothetical protein
MYIAKAQDLEQSTKYLIISQQSTTSRLILLEQLCPINHQQLILHFLQTKHAAKLSRRKPQTIFSK